MRRALAALALVALLAACGGDDDVDATTTTAEQATTTTSTSEPDEATTTTADGESAAAIADGYALELSGGETTGCSSAEPGPEAETNPGCIYSAAFAGCLEGITGEQTAPLPVEEEFATEPALIELYNQAVEDCSS